MSYLLDTHALFWWLYFPERLPPRVRKIVGDPDVRVFTSAVSAYEMSTKHHRGRWPEVQTLVGTFEAVVAAEGFDLLPLSAAHAIRAGSYGPEHHDPFDRMLAAQAVVEGQVLVTKDGRKRGVEVVWGYYGSFHLPLWDKVSPLKSPETVTTGVWQTASSGARNAHTSFCT